MESEAGQLQDEHDLALRSTAELFAEIERLAESNRTARDHETERRMLRLRHLAGIRLMESGQRAAPQHPDPAFDRLPQSRLPDFTAEDLTPGLLRAAILRDGCMIVRGLVDRDRALRFGTQIDRAFEERKVQDAGGRAAPGYYEVFRPNPPFRGPGRGWITSGGGLLAADSPMLAFEMTEMFEAAGVPELVAGYLGEPAAFSLHKTTLRKVEPTAVGAWHQDGAFMGEVHALNLWLSLSRCGDVAPGLDLVPRRLDALVPTGTEGAYLSDQVAPAKAEEAAGEIPIVRPIFEPGDAVLFDDLFLHQTGADPAMPEARFAIECWFFGASEFPEDYAPIAISK